MAAGTVQYMAKKGPSELGRKSVPRQAQIAVWARAAGRCVLCATSLLDSRFQGYHYHSAKLVGQIAHNVAAATHGPRSDSPMSRDERASEKNLLLLCHPCHVNVDDPNKAESFTEERVREMKRVHELRVRRVTNFATLQKTLVMTSSGSIRGDSVRVTDAEITEALVDSNLVAHVHDAWSTDVVIALDDDPTDEAAWLRGRKQIDTGLESLRRGMDNGAVDHVSVFALTYIPWLTYLGSRLDDITSVEVFDRHRSSGARAWCWAEAGNATLEFSIVTSGVEQDEATDVLVITNLTGTVREDLIPSVLKPMPRVVLAPEGVTPAAGLLQTRADLQEAAESWIRLLGQIEATWPAATRLHILGPIPASFAVRMGMHRMKTVHADLVVYHRDGDTYQPTPPITD